MTSPLAWITASTLLVIESVRLSSVEEGRILGELLPGLGDLLGQLVKIRAGRHVSDDPVETSP